MQATQYQSTNAAGAAETGAAQDGHEHDIGDELYRARRRAGLSVFINLMLALGKGVAGVVGGSAALLGDAIHSATDVVASAAAFFGLWLAGKKHPSFPYGLYKAETLATLIVSIAVILAGYEIGRRGLLGPGRLPDVELTLPVALASLVIALGFGILQLRAGRRLHSKALEADARDYLADGLSTAVVVFSLAAAHFGLNFDRWAAGAVSLFVLWAGGQLLWRALRDLMDEAIDRDTERGIIELVQTYPRVERVERCLSRNAGGRFIVDLDVVFRVQYLDYAHRLSHQIETAIRERFPRVVMVAVRIHGHEPEQVKRLTPVTEPEGPVELHLAKAPWFRMETIDRPTQRVLSRTHIQNPHWQAESKRGYLVGKWLLELKPDQVVVAGPGEGTAPALLTEAGVELLPAE
jgi:cation diffusion facilitator family transporter